MKATIYQAEKNERNLTIEFQGRGHWRISCEYRGKTISTITTDSVSIDDFNSEFGEKSWTGCNRVKQGYENLCDEIIRDNK